MAGDAAAALAAEIRAEARALGFDDVGVTDVRPSEHAAFYRAWLAAQRHGSMAYLAREDAVARRLDPASGMPGLRSAIVVAMDYHVPVETDDPARGVIARYAHGRDYHKVMKKKLLALLRAIEQHVGHALPLARAYVDTGPVLERELAQRAGLGWHGRSTMLVNPKRGSYFFIGSLLTELELPVDAPFARDHCGTCTSCVSACPTGALLGRDQNGAPVMDATRCISYLTIENRGAIPRELRPLIGNRIFGCDICQEVCPWNSSKFVALNGRERERERLPGRERKQPNEGEAERAGTRSLIELLETALDEAAWDALSRGSPIRRPGRAGFARNVCVALGNGRSPEAVPVLTDALHDEEPLVRAHAAWALGEIGGAVAIAALRCAASVERDAEVAAGILAALSVLSPAQRRALEPAPSPSGPLL